MIRNPDGMRPELLIAAKRVEQACADAGFDWRDLICGSD